MRCLLFLLLFTVPFVKSFSQVTDSSDIDIKNIRYEAVNNDNYQAFPNARLIIDYYYTTGISTGNRYSYEVILIDSLLMCGFGSPETDEYHYISYEKKILITPAQVAEIKKIVLSSGLSQLKKGAPHPDASAHTKEVLIVKYKDMDVAGGLFNHVSFENDMTQDKIDKEIALERRLTSSIKGNYDILFNTLKKYFADLPALLREVEKTQ